MSLWKTATFLSAAGKVTYDKTSDYIYYYLGYGDSDDHSQHDDEIEQFKGVLDVEKYANEKDNSRILPNGGVYNQYQKWSVFMGNPTLIIDNIYLGSAMNAASYDDLKNNNIKLIINVTKEIRNYFPDEFTYIRYDLYDNNKHSIEKYLEEAYEKILEFQNTTEGNILIHCFMGASRSVSLVLYYLMRRMKHKNGQNFTFDDALEYIKDKRPSINPTFRFTKDLAKSIRE